MIRYAALFLGLLGWISTARDDDANPTEADYYKILTFEPSKEIVLEAGALEWMPDGKVAVSIRRASLLEAAQTDLQWDRRDGHGL